MVTTARNSVTFEGVVPLAESTSDEKKTENAQSTYTEAYEKPNLQSVPTELPHHPRSTTPSKDSILTGRQEHYLKRELLSHQITWEISELENPTALERFGAPFKSDQGEVAPEDSELPILRFIFVNHVRNFPFLDKAREREFWQDKLQVVVSSFASKDISTSNDRLEETKRKKLAVKARKFIELIMVSGLPTASGYEERIQFSDIEIVDSDAQDGGLVANAPSGNAINGWDINVAAVRTTTVKRRLRHHTHAQFLIRVKEKDQPERYVGRRFGEFARLKKQLRIELPGRVLPTLPRKSHSHGLLSRGDDDDDDADSSDSGKSETNSRSNQSAGSSFRSYLPFGGSSTHLRPDSSSRTSLDSNRGKYNNTDNSSTSTSKLDAPRVLYREEQRVSLRAFLRGYLQNPLIAQTKAMRDFLSLDPIELNEEEMDDVARRIDMDQKRIEEQRRFYEIARKRAQQLDIHMEKFRRDIVERNGFSRFFAEIKEKDSIRHMAPEYQKVSEWVRIEVAATLYHLFLAEDNSPEIFGYAKRIHSLVPYMALKQLVRFANPAIVMSGVLDLFLAQPFGARSLLQRITGLALNDVLRSVNKSINALVMKIDDPILCTKIKTFVHHADSETKSSIRQEAIEEQNDLLVTLLKTEKLEPELSSEDVGKVFNAYVAWNNAVENVDDQMKYSAELYARLTQLLKLEIKARDSMQILRMVEEPTTLQLCKDLFTIFYEPLVRVYKSANVYNSITDFARFADDTIAVVEKCRRQDVAADPNQTVQAFIDLCERHEDDLFKFIHEVYLHDGGLFVQLMEWIEDCLNFLRKGPRSKVKLDMNALFAGAVEMKLIDKDIAIAEINSLIHWQEARKRWHAQKTRLKMAAVTPNSGSGPTSTDAAPTATSNMSKHFSAGDFGLDASDLHEFDDDDEDDDSTEDEDEDADPIIAERKRRAKKASILKRTAGEPAKPEIKELRKMQDSFVHMLRIVLAG